MASEVRIARKRARDNLECEGRSQTMADDADFVQTNVPTSCNDDFGKAIQPGVDVSAAAIHVVPGEDPIVQCLLYPPSSAGPVQQANEKCHAEGGGHGGPRNGRKCHPTCGQIC